MDHTATGKGPDNTRVHKYIPYLVNQARYQRLQMTSSSQVPWLSTYIHPNKNGVFGNLITRHDFSICCQNQAEI
jgi:hypothetical protein